MMAPAFSASKTAKKMRLPPWLAMALPPPTKTLTHSVHEGSNMQKLLSHVIDVAAIIVCDGYEVDTIERPAPDVIRLGLDDHEEWFFNDQQVDSDSNGQATVADVGGDERTLVFMTSIPIRECDFPKEPTSAR